MCFGTPNCGCILPFWYFNPRLRGPFWNTAMSVWGQRKKMPFLMVTTGLCSLGNRRKMARKTPHLGLDRTFSTPYFSDHWVGLWKYYEVTQDKEWLTTRGYPVLEEIAKFWASRVERNGPGRYEIKNVIGANEWEENIDNNAFTNGMVKTVMEYASLAAEALGKTPPPDWRIVAQNIPLLKFPDGTTKENETYAGQIIKQADVNLLAYPLKLLQRKTLFYVTWIITSRDTLLMALLWAEPFFPFWLLAWGTPSVPSVCSKRAINQTSYHPLRSLLKPQVAQTPILPLVREACFSRTLWYWRARYSTRGRKTIANTTAQGMEIAYP